MTTYMSTELRKCGACRKDYVTALVTERVGDEISVWQEPCPYCRAAPAPVDARRRGELRTAGSR